MSSLLSRIRKITFELLDKITGSKILNSIEEIKKIDQMDSTNKEIKKFKSESISRLLNHAVKTTSYYKKNNNYRDINDFPIINKDIVKTDYNSFLSYEFNKDDLYQMSTSGSTGNPFISYQNKGKKKRVSAEVIYYSEKVGYSVGNKLIYLRGLTAKTKKNPIKLWLQNEDLIDVSKLGNENIKEVIEGMNRASSSTIVLSYASTLDLISNYCQQNDIKSINNFSGVISSSEMLLNDTRERVSELFKCDVVSRYSNQENGIIGQDEGKNNVFTINEASYFVEIFDLKKDVLIADGEIGRIIVTDLFNYAMPLIRYDTGDVGAKELLNINGRKKYVISNFGGRVVDVIKDSEGINLSPIGIGNKLSKFNNLKQYQIIQKTEKSYVAKIVLNQKSTEVDRENIEKELYNIFGRNSNITINQVPDIPSLPSGKRKYIVSEIE